MILDGGSWLEEPAVAPPQRFARMARAGPLFAGHEAHCIPYSVDTHLLPAAGAVEARRELGIAPDARVLMAIVAPGGERKGPQHLPEVIARIRTSPVTLLTVGGGELTHPVGCSVLNIGEVRSQPKMHACYAAADVFVLPTLADNLPVAILESFACGTPVAAFDVGGVPDLVVTGRTGYLSRYADPADLAGGLDELLADPVRLTSMRRTVRATAVGEYSRKLQADRYLDLYREVRERRVRRSNGGE
ncbi:MAG TPA: glycosyltransferase [Vicinamibacterales bacterium]|nr:glycosyltransferase [Vicinamibacterales bacterium]